MIKINDPDGNLFGVFYSEEDVRNAIEENLDLEAAELYAWRNESFKKALEWTGHYITEDSITCPHCDGEINDNEWIEHLDKYYHSECWDLKMDETYKEDSEKSNKDFYRER